MPEKNAPEGPQYSVDGLEACRVAAGLTQKELADAMGTNQTRIRFPGLVARGMFRDLCGVLRVYPEDLESSGGVVGGHSVYGRARGTEDPAESERAERHRQVERIKAQARYGHRPGTVVLLGLEACRHAAGLTQRELAGSAGMSPAALVQLEKSPPREKWRRTPGAYMRTVKKLCHALGVSPADLICGPKS